MQNKHHNITLWAVILAGVFALFSTSTTWTQTPSRRAAQPRTVKTAKTNSAPIPPAAPAGDTDTRMIGARVVEVTSAHISVVARTGVEHVIAISDEGTKVTLNDSPVALQNLHEGDTVNVELDARNPMMFAKAVHIRDDAQVARNR